MADANDEEKCPDCWHHVSPVLRDRADGNVAHGRLSSGTEITAKLANIAQHSSQVRLTVLLAMLMILYALILAVTLYALTLVHSPRVVVGVGDCDAPCR